MFYTTVSITPESCRARGSRTCAAIFPDTLCACPRAIRKPPAFITRREKIEPAAGVKPVYLVAQVSHDCRRQRALWLNPANAGKKRARSRRQHLPALSLTCL